MGQLDKLVWCYIDKFASFNRFPSFPLFTELFNSLARIFSLPPSLLLANVILYSVTDWLSSGFNTLPQRCRFPLCVSRSDFSPSLSPSLFRVVFAASPRPLSASDASSHHISLVCSSLGRVIAGPHPIRSLCLCSPALSSYLPHRPATHTASSSATSHYSLASFRHHVPAPRSR